MDFIILADTKCSLEETQSITRYTDTHARSRRYLRCSPHNTLFGFQMKLYLKYICLKLDEPRSDDAEGMHTT